MMILAHLVCFWIVLFFLKYFYLSEMPVYDRPVSPMDTSDAVSPIPLPLLVTKSDIGEEQDESP